MGAYSALMFSFPPPKTGKINSISGGSGVILLPDMFTPIFIRNATGENQWPTMYDEKNVNEET